jgi:hypothetical protein
MDLNDFKDLDLSQLDLLPREDLVTIANQLKALKNKTFLDYIPQEYQKRYHLAKTPVKMIIGGNRSGKTISAFHEVLWQLTGKYPEWYPIDLMLETPVYVRWIATDFKNGIGSVFQPYFDRLVPSKFYKRIVKTQQGVLNKVFFDNGSILDLMTDEQDVSEFEGWSGQRLHIDEPCSRDRYIASKRGLIDYSGQASFSLTPLSEPWIYDELYTHADGINIFQVTVDMRENKFLKQEEIAEFEKALTDDEKEARIHGRFMHLSGVVYKEFNKDIHIVKDFEIPDNWKRLHVLDPHDRKPHANIWLAVDPYDNLYLHNEADITGTIEELSRRVKAIEGFKKADLRIIDPNKGHAPSRPGDKGDLIDEFAKYGLRFYGDVCDDIVEGHLAVKKYLMYDKTQPISIMNAPKLHIFESCKLSIKGMTHYIWDEHKDKDKHDQKEKPRDQHKDYPDCIRYAIMAKPKFKRPRPFVGTSDSNCTGY